MSKGTQRRKRMVLNQQYRSPTDHPFFHHVQNCFIAPLPQNVQAQPPPPETPGRLQESLTNYPDRPTAQRGGGSPQRPS
jgi:hypothetical protein